MGGTQIWRVKKHKPAALLLDYTKNLICIREWNPNMLFTYKERQKKKIILDAVAEIKGLPEVSHRLAYGDESPS